MSEQKEKYINPLIGFDFEELFDEARIAKLTPEERKTFQANLKYYRDLKNVVDTAREEGKKERRNEIAKELKKNKVPTFFSLKKAMENKNIKKDLLCQKNDAK